MSGSLPVPPRPLSSAPSAAPSLPAPCVVVVSVPGRDDVGVGILYNDGKVLICGDRPDEGEVVSLTTLRSQHPNLRLTCCPPGRGVGACIADVLRANGYGQYAGQAAALSIAPVTILSPGQPPTPALLFPSDNRVKFRVGSSARVVQIGSLFSNGCIVASRDVPAHRWG